jgi:small subunit ribosomal protein S20
MPTHQSAIKRMRQNEKRRKYNKSYRTRARKLVKEARQAIKAGDASEAEEATRAAVRMLDKIASKGIIHKRNAARRKGRLMSQLADLQNS